jgi:hypothetical protein
MALAADASAAMLPAFSPPPAFIAGAGGVTALGGASAAVPTGGTSGGDEPRLRKNFPETLYVNPQLITGSDGKTSMRAAMDPGALDLFATVAELAQDAPLLRVSPAYARVHYLACDSSADCAVFEYIQGQLVITRAPDMLAKALANNTYAASATYLAGFTGFGGAADMPTSTSSLDRFVRASMLAKTTAGTSIPDSAFAILDSVSQSNTVWSIVYALKDGKVHFRTKAVPKVKSVELATFSFACGARKILDIDTDSTGDVGARFVEYTPAANQALLGQTMATMASELPAGALDLVAAYPDTCKCASGAGSGGPQGGGGAGGDSPSSVGCSCAMGDPSRFGLGALAMGLTLARRLLRRRRS